MGMMTIPFFKTNVLTGFKGAYIISGPKVMGDIIKKAEGTLLVLGARVLEHFIGQRPHLEYCLQLSKRLGIPICATAQVIFVYFVNPYLYKDRVIKNILV